MDKQLVRICIMAAMVAMAAIDLAGASCEDYTLGDCRCEYPVANRYFIQCEDKGLSSMPPPNTRTMTNGYATANFSFNSISSIPDKYFDEMRHFDNLDFTSNNIKSISSESFEGLGPKLRMLNLSRNSLESIDVDTFKDFSRLDLLDLSGNSISSPCGINTFDVKEYSLARNSIAKLSAKCFEKSKEVVRLNLAGNRISSISSEAFAELGNLKSLDLSYNAITDLGRGLMSLRDLKAFEWLSLEGNRLRTLTSVCPFVLRDIRMLNFGHNQLDDIETYCFNQYGGVSDGLTIELSFEHNKLKKLDSYHLAGLTKRLQTLRLNNNQITTINDNTFDGHEYLKYLYLDHNQLKDMDFLRTWMGNVVEELSVSYNMLETLPANAFSTLKSLQKLNLQGNRLLSIEAETFTGLPNLLELKLDYNLLTDLSGGAFNGLAGLKRLSLSGNALVTLKSCTFEVLKNLEQFHFEDNLLMCDCDLLWLVDYIKKVKTAGFNAKAPEPVLPDDCHHPADTKLFIQKQVSDCPPLKSSASCFGLDAAIQETENNGETANVTWTWADRGTQVASSVVVTQHDVETGEELLSVVVEDGTDMANLKPLEDEKIYKVCVTVQLDNGKEQKDCDIWPEMIKLPPTPAPQTVTTTEEPGTHPAVKAAIALAIILIILIIILILIGVYLWRTRRYKYLIPDKVKELRNRRRAENTDHNNIDVEETPTSNGSSKKDPLEFEAAERQPMMTEDL